MTTPANPETLRRRPAPRRLLPALAAFAFATSACSAIPFGGDDAGQDIAAVDVQGVEPGTASDGAQLSATRADDASTATNGAQSDSTQSGAAGTNEAGASDDASGNSSTETTTSGATVTVDDRFVGRRVEYLSTDLALGTISTTNQQPSDLLKGVEGDLDEPVILIEVTATSRNGVSVSFPDAVFGLVDESGARFAPIDVLDRRGDRMYTVGVEAQATTQFVLVFPETDLAGASFVVSEAGLLPEIIPLTDTDTTQQSPYSSDLGAPSSQVSITAPGINDSCNLSMDVQIQSATAVLEGNDQFSFERAALGERFVEIDLAVTNTNEPDIFSVCGAGFSAFQIEPRLEVNGVSLAPVNPSDFTTIEIDATVSTRYVFRIDAGSADLRLVSLTGDVIAEWSTELGPVVGE